MSEQTRRCKILDPEFGEHYYGDFIQWGYTYEFDRHDSKFQLTVALVETDEGRVVMVCPERIVFVKDKVKRVEKPGGDTLYVTSG